MNDDIINLESRLVFRDVSKLTAGGMSTAAALAHAAHEAAERKAKMTTGFAQDDYIRSLEEQIATLQSELAERWENLNVQDGVIEGLREEIASWQRVHRAEYEKREALDARLAALEKVQTNLATFVRRLAYALRNHDGAATLRHQAHDYLTRNNLAGDPLREAGYLGGGDE